MIIYAPSELRWPDYSHKSFPPCSESPKLFAQALIDQQGGLYQVSSLFLSDLPVRGYCSCELHRWPETQWGMEAVVLFENLTAMDYKMCLLYSIVSLDIWS